MISPAPASRTIRDTITAFSVYLTGKAVDSPRLSAEMLLAHVLKIERLRLLVLRDTPLTEEQYTAAEQLVLRRGNGEPVAYLTGERDFYGRQFKVTQDTLIPRPDTELLIDTALNEVSRQPSGRLFRFADLGTGSGCIAVSLAAESALCHGVAVDKSSKALAVAKNNAETHSVSQQLDFICADFSTGIFSAESFDMIISNPPYISDREYAELDHGVRNFEPKSALVPDCTDSCGLEDAKRLLPLVHRWLKPGGIFLMEFGWKQGADILKLVEASGVVWNVADILKDLEGRDRALLARRCD
ncbi:peptide chain release factor N(5)-glutamine methyltransferase [Oleidesulfovibrio sp.]|uniref:peptide chain release factor N(5)-glutamine methyltransferase n=1 Tax=Oleidesulfovibrio sp. TaxID=2909707 RepID=UPI003A84D90F